MRCFARKLLKDTRTALKLGYRIVRGISYQTLSQDILRINQHKDIDAILREVSRCLKDIMDYELYGFALKSGGSMDIWMDPRAYSATFTDIVAGDYDSQNIDYKFHCFTPPEQGHNDSPIDINNLISYKVVDNHEHVARLYILPRIKMPYHHDTIISTIISAINIALEKNLNIQQLESVAAIDPLTNCYNRRALDSFIKSDIAFAQRSGSELSVIMIDVDDFKAINDAYGHQAGDEVLKDICRLLTTMVRKSDYCARYGGEEFTLVLPATTLFHASRLADKIRQKIEEHVISVGKISLSLTASFGVASLERKPDAASLFREADERLYAAKKMGKNRVFPSMRTSFAERRYASNKLGASPRTHPSLVKSLSGY
jgi:diguanylate cyclase (GGDEF)-like protein